MVTVEQAGRLLRPLFKGAVLLLAGVASLLHAQRPDVVVMKNGDRFTCTLNKLRGGLLYIDVDYVSGSVGLDWAQVQRVESHSTFQVTMDDGTRSLAEIQRGVSEDKKQ